MLCQPRPNIAIFSRLKLCPAAAGHNFKRLKIPSVINVIWWVSLTRRRIRTPSHTRSSPRCSCSRRSVGSRRRCPVVGRAEVPSACCPRLFGDPLSTGTAPRTPCTRRWSTSPASPRASLSKYRIIPVL